jgi:signal transduction histidine kinase
MSRNCGEERDAAVTPIDPDKLTTAYERDRSRIARQLHDDIGQRLALLTLDLDLVDQALPLSTADLRERLRHLSDRVLELAKDVQAMSHSLHSSSLEFLGIVAASAAYCREVSQESGVRIEFRDQDVPDHVAPEVALTLFRVLQEAVGNAVKHAEVSQLSVSLHAGVDGLQLEIADRGSGFDPDTVLRGRGLGIVAMQERVRLVRGELAIESRPGGGTTIRACVPPGEAGLPLEAAI